MQGPFFLNGPLCGVGGVIFLFSRVGVAGAVGAASLPAVVVGVPSLVVVIDVG